MYVYCSKPCFRNRKQLRDIMGGLKPSTRNTAITHGDPMQNFHFQVQSHCDQILRFTEQIKQKNAYDLQHTVVGDKVNLLNDLEE